MKQKQKTILAIETSCDDTGVAVLKIENCSPAGGTCSKLKILSNVVSSQVKIHAKWGGVYPMMAKREHQKNLVSLLIKALKKAKLLKTKTKNAKLKTQNHNLKLKTLIEILSRENYLLKSLSIFLKKYKKPDIYAIAVTVGPGLEPCLWVGVNFAKSLAYYWNLPIIPVNHIESHILVNFLNKRFQVSSATLGGARLRASSIFQELFPAVCLVVSGGHTQLILMKDVGKYKILGETRDDAAGECFDKTARILGLEYPGGPAIAKLAEVRPLRACGGATPVKLPRPMINSKDYNFSFSGLKTALLYSYQKSKATLGGVRSASSKNQKYIQEMSKEIQQAVIDVLIKKTIKAAKDLKAKTIILGGGVSANKELRKQFAKRIKKDLPDTKYLIPDTSLSTDNALMTAVAGYFRYKKKKSWKNIKVNANLRIEQ